MKIWRPEDRFDWWMAFIASVLLLPLAIGFVGVMLAEAGFPYLLLVAMFIIPLAGTYLLFVTKLHIAIRIIFVLTLNYALLSAFQPRTTCEDYEAQETTAEVAGSHNKKQEGCS